MISDRVAVIRAGRLVASGTLEALLDTSLEADVRIAADDQVALAALAGCGRVLATEAALGGLLRVRLALSDRAAVPGVAAAVVGAGGRLYGLQAKSRSLEDVFIELVAEQRSASG